MVDGQTSWKKDACDLTKMQKQAYHMGEVTEFVSSRLLLALLNPLPRRSHPQGTALRDV